MVTRDGQSTSLIALIAAVAAAGVGAGCGDGIPLDPPTGTLVRGDPIAAVLGATTGPAGPVVVPAGPDGPGGPGIGGTFDPDAKLEELPLAEGDAAHRPLAWDELSGFPYRFPETFGDPPPDAIPETLLARNDTDVVIRGFMMPSRFEGEAVVEFVLIPNQNACCFGRILGLNEQVQVRIASDGTTPFAMDVPLTVWGRLSVGERFAHGELLDLYRLEATRVDR